MIGLDEVLRALAHPDRRRFLLACRDRSFAAGELVELSSLSAATVSEHLKVLRKTGLLVLERRGKQWLYRTDPAVARRAIAETLVQVGETETGGHGDGA